MCSDDVEGVVFHLARASPLLSQAKLPGPIITKVSAPTYKFSFAGIEWPSGFTFEVVDRRQPANSTVGNAGLF